MKTVVRTKEYTSGTYKGVRLEKYSFCVKEEEVEELRKITEGVEGDSEFIFYNFRVFDGGCCGPNFKVHEYLRGS